MGFNSFEGTILIVAIIFFIVVIAVACLFGTITQAINNRKGYAGGFGWGFWLGWIGIIVVACRRSARSRYGTPSTVQNPQGGNGNGWQCTCGRFHSSYVSTCSCGINKRDLFSQKAKAAAAQSTSTPQQPTAQSPINLVNETQTIAALKEYKELLDTGVITQEEFDAKKKELLSH